MRVQRESILLPVVLQRWIVMESLLAATVRTNRNKSERRMSRRRPRTSTTTTTKRHCRTMKMKEKRKMKWKLWKITCLEFPSILSILADRNGG
jgi:hypothetical protein